MTDSKFDLSLISEEKYDILELAGEFDSFALKVKKPQIEELLQKTTKPYFLINMVNVTFVNSESVSFLISINDILAAKNIKFVLINARQNVFEVLNVVGAFEAIKYYNTLTDFLKSLSS